MNFKRIQIMFIIAFTTLNLVLLSSLLWTTHYRGSTPNQDQTAQTLKEMKNDMISYHPHSHHRQDGYYFSAKQKELPAHTNDLRGVTVHNDGDMINVEFTHPVEVKNASLQESVLNDVINNRHQVIDGDRYKYNDSLSSKHVAVYTQMIKGRPFQGKEGQIRFRINDAYQATGYSQGELSGISLLRPRSRAVSETQAVVWLYKHNQIPNNSKIRQTDYGYSQLTERRGQKVLIPTWLVEVKAKNDGSSNVLRVNALTGSMIKKQSNN